MKFFLTALFLSFKVFAADVNDFYGQVYEAHHSSEECVQHSKKYVQEVHQYYNLINSELQQGYVIDHRSEARELSGQTLKALRDELDHDYQCAITDFSTYVVASFVEYQDAYNNDSPRYEKLMRFSGDRRMVTDYFLEMLRNEKVEILTDSIRQALSENGKYKLWSEKKDGNYLLAGAFSCKEKRIFLSTSLRPLDMVATVVHEMDHFFRDLNPIDPNEKRSIRELVFWDEFVATLHGAYFQGKMLMMTKTNGQFLKAPEQDRSFFMTNGPVQQILMSDPTARPYFLKFLNVLHLSSEVSKLSEKPSDITVAQNQSEAVVWQGYFGSSAKNSLRYDMNMTESKYSLSTLTSPGDELATRELAKERIRAALHDLEWSPSCKRFQDAVKNGSLEGYFGVIKGSNKSQTGAVDTEGNEGGGGVGTEGSEGGGGVGTDNSGMSLEIHPSIRPCLIHEL